MTSKGRARDRMMLIVINGHCTAWLADLSAEDFNTVTPIVNLFGQMQRRRS
jgi:hypothetical protein